MDSTRIKQYGVQRTGTNAVKALLEANCPDVSVLTSTYGSKHDRPGWRASIDPDLLFLVSIKDPVSWMASYYRYRALQAREQHPRVTLPPKRDLVPSWLALWQDRTTAYLDLAEVYPERTAVVQHETLLRDPSFVLRHTAGHLGLSLYPGEHELFLAGYARRGAEQDRGAELINVGRPFSRAYHLDGEWSRELPRTVIRQCRRAMDSYFTERPEFRGYFNLTHLENVR